MSDPIPGTPLLEIKNLEVGFQTTDGLIPAVRGIDLEIYPGETLAIVGESGSGKSTTAHAIINLLPGSGRITGGSVMFEGRDLTKLKTAEIESVRGRLIGLVPQDPMQSLNPVWNIGFQVEEAIRANGLASTNREVRKRAIQVLQEAGLQDADKRLRQFPHQFSGGMRQRVLIGIGLSAGPKLLIADEPTSALDVTVQRRILDHLEKLTDQTNTAVIFITHDLGLAAERAENIVVMHRGKIVESGPATQILQDPKHPYTQRLVAAAPSLASRRIQSAVKSHSGIEHVSGAAEFDLGRTAEVSSEIDAKAVPVIEFRDATKVFKIRTGSFTSSDFKAVDGVSFSVPKGSTMALVGESGSGKSTAAKLLLGLERLTSGSVFVNGADVSKLNRKEFLAIRRQMQPVFQDPYGSLDPLHNIGNTISEPLRIHNVGDLASRKARVAEVLEQVALPTELATRYPNELSGGQRQRVAIARALALKPDIVVLDEAVSALDVLVQAQVLNLLAELQSELGLTYLFITHDLAVVRVIADHVCVMEKGKIVEQSTVDEVFENPKEAYTRELLDAIPGSEDPARQVRLGRVAPVSTRVLGAATAFIVAAAVLSGCTPTTTVVEGSEVTVAVSAPYTSANASTSFGRSSPTNADVAYLTSTGFGYYDDSYEFVEDPSFGSAVVLDESPFTVRYSVSDSARWSDGVPVDAADLLLAWAGNSGSLNTAGFEDADFVDQATGQYTDDFPDDVVFFDGSIGSGLELATATPRIVEDRAIEVVYDDYFPGWRLALAPGVAAHVVAQRALDLDDGAGPAADEAPEDPAADAEHRDAAMAAKAELVAAVVGVDTPKLAELSRFWNTAYNLTETPDDPALLLSSGPYTVTGIVDNESVTLTANPEYVGDRKPTYETIELRVSPDPLETVDLLERHQVDIATPQPTEDVVSALVGVDDVTVTAGSEGTFEHLDLQFADSRTALFDDIRVRQAFLLVVPRQQIVDDLVTPVQQDAGLLDSFVLRPGAEGYAEADRLERLPRVLRDRRGRGHPPAHGGRRREAAGVHPVRPVEPAPRRGVHDDPRERRTCRVRGDRLLQHRLGGSPRGRRRLRRRPVRLGHHAPRPGRRERRLRERLEARQLQPLQQPRGRPADRGGGCVGRPVRGHPAPHRHRRRGVGRCLRPAAVRVPDGHGRLGRRHRRHPLAIGPRRLLERLAVDPDRHHGRTVAERLDWAGRSTIPLPALRARIPLFSNSSEVFPWLPPAAPTCATSRSSPTSTTARRRSSTPCCARPTPSARTSTWRSGPWTPTTWSARRASRSSRRTPRSATRACTPPMAP